MVKNNIINAAVKHFHARGFVTSSTLLQVQNAQQCPAGVGSPVEGVSSGRLKDYKEMPGPKPLPIIGNAWRFVPGIGEYAIDDFCKIMKNIHEKYGDIVRMEKIFSIPDSVYTYNPEDIEKVYKTESHMPERFAFPTITYHRTVHRKNAFEKAKGLAITNGPEWYKIRTDTNPVLMQPRIVKLYVDGIEDIAESFVKSIKKNRNAENKLPYDFLREVNKYSLEGVCYIALDKKLNCFSEQGASENALKMIDATLIIFQMLFELDFQPSLWKIIKTPKFHKMMNALDTQLFVGKQFLDEAEKSIEEKKKNNVITEKEPSVLEKLLAIDRDTAIVMAMDMMLAGIDTTSNAFTSLMYYLATNKAVQEKLRKEITTVLPDEGSRLTDKNLDQLPYLKACFKEGARIFPVAPVGFRQLTKDMELSGYKLTKGTGVFFPMMYVSRQEKHFPRPDEFIPERWLREMGDSELSYKNAHPFASVPFGFGARSCIGRRIADLELEVALIAFIRNFDISWNGPPPKVVTTSVNYMKDLHFVFNEVKKN